MRVAIPPLSQYIFRAQYLVQRRDNFILSEPQRYAGISPPMKYATVLGSTF
jgi:hypothetical protein